MSATPTMLATVMEATSADLLERIAAGDQAAFAEFYDRCAGRILGLLCRILGARDAAEEVLQETFWYVWRAAAQYDPSRATPEVWLVMIARSRARDHLRRRPRTVDTGARAVEAGDAAGQLESAEAVQAACCALARLPTEQRDLIHLAFYGGLTHQEIAQTRGLPLGTVKTRIRSGMQRLRELLYPEGARA